MENLCTRCQQTLADGACFCAHCGLPQLVCNFDGEQAPRAPEPWPENLLDAGSIRWRRALGLCLMLGLPAGIVNFMATPLGMLSFLLMGFAAAWVVILYVRSEQAAWITTGAGARIGLVTGLAASLAALATTATTLYVQHNLLGQPGFLDTLWREQQAVMAETSQQWIAAGADASRVAANNALFASPEGKAGLVLAANLVLSGVLVLFSVAGGALSARRIARVRRG